MDEAQNKRYQDLVAKNLIDEEKLINSKKALSKEIIELKKLIDEKNKHINKYKIMEEKLLEINKNQDKEISKLKDSIKMILKNLNDQKIESKEEVKLLKKELNESKSSISQLENKLIDSDEKVSQLENKLKDSEKTITFIEKKLNYSEKNSEKKITLLNIELGIANGKQLELVNDIKKLKDCIIKLNEKIDKKEEEYNFMKNLNLQNNQSAITNNGLLRCLNLISKDYELIKSKLDEKNEQLENIKKMFKKNK
jgi:chromosome segregation ATPase